MRLEKEGWKKKKRKREKEREREKLAMFRQRPTDARQRDRETHSLVHVVFWIPWSLSLPLPLFLFLSITPSLSHLTPLLAYSRPVIKEAQESLLSIPILYIHPCISAIHRLRRDSGSNTRIYPLLPQSPRSSYPSCGRNLQPISSLASLLPPPPPLHVGSHDFNFNTHLRFK